MKFLLISAGMPSHDRSFAEPAIGEDDEYAGNAGQRIEKALEMYYITSDIQNYASEKIVEGSVFSEKTRRGYL